MATFDENGKYIKTVWKAGDKITSTKLNKIEESIEAVNNNDISRHIEADSRLDVLEAGAVTDKKELNNKIDALEDVVNANKDATDLEIYKLNSDMEQLFQSVSNGKSLIASAITDKGVITASDDTFATMANNIRSLNSAGAFIDDIETNNIFMYGFDDSSYTLKFEDNNGTLDSFADVCVIKPRMLSNNSIIYQNNDLITYNIAPYSATKIGVYDSDNVKVAEMPLENFKPAYGERLYRFGLLADVHNNAGAGSGSENASSESREDLERALKFFNDKESVWATCIAGDLTDTGAEDQLQIYKTNVDTNSPNTPVYACAGNHDCRSNVSDAIWEQYTGNKRCFEITKGKDHFLFFGMSKESMGPSGSPYTQENIDWLADKLDRYRNERCFIFMHLFFPDRSGNLKRLYHSGNWLGGSQLTQIQGLCDHYVNTIWFSGHSHWQWDSQQYEQDANIWKAETSGWCVHVPSCAVPKYIANANAGTSYNNPASEGAIVDVYDNYIDIRAMDLKNEKYLPIAQYRLDTTLVNVASVKTIDDVTDDIWWCDAYIDSATGQLSTRESGYSTSTFNVYDSTKQYILHQDSKVSATRVFFYDSNKVFISCTNQMSSTEFEVLPPSNTAYIRYRTKRVGISLDETYDHIYVTTNSTSGPIFNGVYDEAHWFDYYIDGSTGELSSEKTGYSTTAYIQCGANVYYILELDATVEATRVFYYDSNRAFISSTDQISSSGRFTLETPANTAYIRIRSHRIDITNEDVPEHVKIEIVASDPFNDVYNDAQWYPYYIDSTTGELASDWGTYATTAFIQYDNNNIYTLTVPTACDQHRIFFYDSNKTFISSTDQILNPVEPIVMDYAPTGTAYFRYRERYVDVDFNTFVSQMTFNATARPAYNVTNIVPTLQAGDSTAPFDGVGYRDNAYISSSSHAESTYNGFVLTGYIPITVSTSSAPTIYVRGVEVDTTNSYTRLTIYDAEKDYLTLVHSAQLSQYYITETLGDKYYKLTPAYAESTGNCRLSNHGTGQMYVRFSFKGVGANLVMTLDQPIN